MVTKHMKHNSLNHQNKEQQQIFNTNSTHQTEVVFQNLAKYWIDLREEWVGYVRYSSIRSNVQRRDAGISPTQERCRTTASSDSVRVAFLPSFDFFFPLELSSAMWEENVFALFLVLSLSRLPSLCLVLFGFWSRLALCTWEAQEFRPSLRYAPKKKKKCFFRR